MSLFSTNRTKRHTAFVALLVWLFALASGMANACLLETPGTHSHVATGGFSETAPPAAALKGQGESGDGHDDDLGVAKQSCLKTCDDGLNTLVKLQTGLDLTGSGPVLLGAIPWTAATPVVLAPHPLNELVPLVVGPPFRVRYSRLAL